MYTFPRVAGGPDNDSSGFSVLWRRWFPERTIVIAQPNVQPFQNNFTKLNLLTQYDETGVKQNNFWIFSTFLKTNTRIETNENNK